MTRWFVVGGISIVLVVTPACATRQPVPALGHVPAPHAIRVRFRWTPDRILFDFGNGMYSRDQVARALADGSETFNSFAHVLRDTLRRAGYEVNENGPSDVDVVPEFHAQAEPREARHGRASVGVDDIDRVALRVYDPQGEAIDRLEVHATDGAAPGAAERRSGGAAALHLLSPSGFEPARAQHAIRSSY